VGEGGGIDRGQLAPPGGDGQEARVPGRPHIRFLQELKIGVGCVDCTGGPGRARSLRRRGTSRMRASDIHITQKAYIRNSSYKSIEQSEDENGTGG